jgi:Zn-dependent M28 family amino/carboxypeptidase
MRARRSWRYETVSLIFAISISAFAQPPVRLEPRAVIEKRLKSFAGDNDTREETIHHMLAQSGCTRGNLSETVVREDLPPNVVCVLPGETRGIILVGAHTDKVEAGEGVVDNWSGASLLPSLLFSMTGQKPRHTFVFVGFSAEEKGMLGSVAFAEHLTPEQRSRIKAVVNMDSLGVAPTKVWASHADKTLLDALFAVSARTNLPVSILNVDGMGSTDSESFGRYHIPRITLHSVTLESMKLLHSPNDTLAAIRFDDYYDSYRLIAEYLAYLDYTLTPTAPVGNTKAAN